MLDIARSIGVREPRPGVELSVLSRREEVGYDELAIAYAVRGEQIPAFLLMPSGEAPPRSRPAVLVLHQHASQWHFGKSEVAGRAGDPLQAFGPALARRGWVVLAPDAIGFEDRRAKRRGIEPADDDRLQYLNAMAHRLVRGELLMRDVLEDAMAAVSVLGGLDAVDGERLGAIGHSYGGNTVLFLGAVDRRVRFGCASGAACSYRDKIARGVGIEMAMVIPGFAENYDVEDLLRAFAPRPMLLVSGESDPYSRDAPDLVERAGGTNITHHRDAGGHAMTQARFARIIAWVSEQ